MLGGCRFFWLAFAGSLVCVQRSPSKCWYPGLFLARKAKTGMSVIIKGIVKYNKTIDGDYQQGARKGEHWEFLSLEIVDNQTGFTWSAQLPSEDQSYKAIADQSLKGHVIKAKIASQSAGERSLPN